MNAGRFDELVELWSYTVENNSYGEPIKTWSKYEDAWARVEAISGSEIVSADKREHQQLYNITIRYNSSVSVYDQIKYNGIMHKIMTITEIDRKMYLRLYCEQSY
jgi:SPP1 family predicted phage head-tail adaptor